MDLSELTTSFEVKEDTLSLYKAVKENPKDKIEVEIGDSKDLTTFQPQAKIMRWDNEVNLSVRYKDSDTSQLVADSKDDVIEWVKSDKEVHIYEKPEVSEDGGLEIEVVLKKKPINNVIEFSIETKNLEFFYQPELTREEIDDGRWRPENVIGSYAVYYKGCPVNRVGGKEYRVGKFCHIFRPKVVDAKGSQVWGKLNVDIGNNLLTITIDEGWLKKAVYPVIVDPTIGNTHAGTSSAAGVANQLVGYPGDSGAIGGSVDSISQYGKNFQYTTISNLKGIMVNTDLEILSNGITGAITLGYGNTSVSWRTMTYTTKPTIEASTTYYACFICTFTNREYMSYYDSASPTPYMYDSSNSYTSPVDPTDASVGTNGNTKWSLYATYTEAASGPTGVKTINGTAIASVKTVNATAIASVKTING